MDVRKTIGENVRKHRLDAGMSQEELALRIGKADQGYISRLEIGKRNPTAITLCVIAQALGVDVGQLFQGIDQTKKRGAAKISSARSGRTKARIR